TVGHSVSAEREDSNSDLTFRNLQLIFKTVPPKIHFIKPFWKCVKFDIPPAPPNLKQFWQCSYGSSWHAVIETVCYNHGQCFKFVNGGVRGRILIQPFGTPQRRRQQKHAQSKAYATRVLFPHKHLANRGLPASNGPWIIQLRLLRNAPH